VVACSVSIINLSAKSFTTDFVNGTFIVASQPQNSAIIGSMGCKGDILCGHLPFKLPVLTLEATVSI
jgi:hypothetical protein